MRYSDKYKQELDDALQEKDRLDKVYGNPSKISIPKQEKNKRRLELLGLAIKIKTLRQKYFRARSLESDGMDSSVVEGWKVW